MITNLTLNSALKCTLISTAEKIMSNVPPIVRLLRACEPNESLSPDDKRYVDFDSARGDSPAPRCARSLRRADSSKPEIKLLAGHRGIGKTSELLRLKQLLESPNNHENLDLPFKVIFFDVNETLDINDLDFPDLLVLIAGEVQSQLKKAAIPGFTATSAYLQRVWEDVKLTLGADVNLKDFEADIPFGKLAIEFKNRPTSRSRLRAAIEMHNTGLSAAVNDLLMTANVALRKNGRNGLVLLIDGLDKVVFRPLDDGTSNTHVRLFCDRAEQLASLKAHTVYTVPISLAYSPRAAQLAQAFGEHTQPMSMISLRGKNKAEPTVENVGMSKMWEMLERRCAFAEVDIKHVFDKPETGHYLCQMTGGHPRHLMMFMQAAINAVDKLPITQDVANKAVNNYANSLLREIPDNFWKPLRNFKTPQPYIPKDELHQQMLFYLHVFEYMNGEPWYEVNPVIRELPKFNQQ
ncbi:MAG TPA: hypothetical protein VGI03_11480 [Verrucomicrobiae bacterium]|jgi:hypothetical protein